MTISRSIASPIARPLSSPLAGGGGGTPVPVNLGMTTVGAIGPSSSSPMLSACGPYTALSSGPIQSISLYTSQAESNITLGVWLDNAGTIGELVAVSEGGASVAGGWVTLPASGDIVSGQDYWIGWNVDVLRTYTYDTAPDGTRKYKTVPYAAGELSDPFPASPTEQPRRYPLYLTYLGS